MENAQGHKTSIWMAAAPGSFPALHADIRADVCVVGAGLTGLTTAYLLTQAGRSVVVLEDGDVANGATCRTTAHLTAALDDRYYELERLHGVDGARLAAESHSAAIDLIESIVEREKIDCGFTRVDGYLFLHPDHGRDVLEKEFQATQRAGLPVQWQDAGPYSSFDMGPCLRFRQQAQFHPLKYLSALARCIGRRGGQIYTKTHASQIDSGAPARVLTTANVAVTADAVVIATNTPISNRVVLHTKQAPYLTYVIGARVPKGSAPRVLAWDTGDPYHYLRIVDSWSPYFDLLLVGGEDHKTGQAADTEQRFTHLETWTRDRFPQATQIDFRWSGQIMEPVDYLAFIGRNPMDDPNIYVATGDSGNGMTHGTIAGRLLTDLILGHDNPWASLYDPSRIRLGAAKDFASENANVVVQYASWVTAGETESVEAIVPGSGMIMRQGLKKLAVYRDEAGEIHAFRATCPHLGCIVEWNKTEQTWDCPCHGSRFDALGHVINGPANRNLAPEATEAIKRRA